VIEAQNGLTVKEKNQIITRHNNASDRDIYGQELYSFCQQLEKEKKVVKGFAHQIYVLSVDWPLDFALEKLPEAIIESDTESSDSD
jgi:hypothetical protein